jgi:uncharacterized protein YwgA
LDIPVDLYAPFGTSHQELQVEFLEGREKANRAPASRVSPAWLAIVEILSRIEAEPYHWPVGRILFQKIAYFATESGIRTGLQYRRGSFGSHSPDLRQEITRLVNNGLVVEKRLGKMFMMTVGPTFEDAKRAFESELNHWEPVINKVADLFLRMRTQQAEVAATVHFATRVLSELSNRTPTEDDVLQEVMRWKSKRRPPLTEHEVALAVRNLGVLGWLNVEGSTNLPLEDTLLEV